MTILFFTTGYTCYGIFLVNLFRWATIMVSVCLVRDGAGDGGLNLHVCSWSNCTDQGVLQTVSRGCRPTELKVNRCEEDAHSSKCNFFCDTNLCNGDVIADDVNGRDVIDVVKIINKNAVVVDVDSMNNNIIGDDGNDDISLSNILSDEARNNLQSNDSEEGFIWCYSCTYSYHPDADTTCLEDPASVDPIYGYPVQCSSNNTYGCQTYQLWDKGEISAFSAPTFCASNTSLMVRGE